MVTLLGFGFVRTARRAFSTTSISLTRFQPRAPPDMINIGRFVDTKPEYEPGQMFLHKIFAYRGVILCAFSCKVTTRAKAKEAMSITELVPYYQVLIHKDDWDFLGFPFDMTYLGQSPSGEERALNIIHGMDCVSHHDVIPYRLPEDGNSKAAFQHDYFDRLFKPCDNSEDRDFKSAQELSPPSCWLTPQTVYREVSENIEVQVMTYFLGTNLIKGQVKHCWRYVTRLQNLDPKRVVVLRERIVKVYSLNNLSHAAGNSLCGEPYLTQKNPVYQFSSHIHLLQAKGAHMWGQLKFERDNGEIFEVNVPTVQLDSTPDSDANSAENSLL